MSLQLIHVCALNTVFKAHVWISFSDNKILYLCFIVEYLLKMFYCWRILVFFALSDGYICFCLNTYLHLPQIIFFDVDCLFLCCLYIYIYMYIYIYIYIYIYDNNHMSLIFHLIKLDNHTKRWVLHFAWCFSICLLLMLYY